MTKISKPKGKQRESKAPLKGMPDLRTTIANGLAERYTYLATTVRELAAKLNEEQFWQKPFPFGNSFGHLVLHLTGNLNYYIGTEIAGSGYVRDRDREFTEPTHFSKAEVLKNFDGAIEVVIRAIRAQSEGDWSKSYTAVREEDAGNRFNVSLRCATHLHHHVGQMVYLCFELGKNTG